MSTIFGSKPKTPKLPSPEPLPQAQPLAAEVEMKDESRKKGYLQSFYAGSLKPPSLGKWNRLGGTGAA